MMFTDSLEMELKLYVGKEKFTIPGGHIKLLKAALTPNGYAAEAGFWVSSETGEDELFPEFIKLDLMKVELMVQAHLMPDDADDAPLNLKGVVTGKALLKELTIENVNVKEDPVLYRYYRINFEDTGRVLWGQHYPCDLVVDGTVKDLIDANRADVELDYEWDPLNTRFSINTLPGYTHHQCASFYDFLVWFAEFQNGALYYDYEANSYMLTGSKSMEGTPVELHENEVAELTIEFPETSRTNDKFLNTFSDNPKKKETTRPQAVEALRQDALVRYAIASDFEDAFTVESEKQKIRGYELRLVHSRYPCCIYRPGAFAKLKEAIWSSNTLTHKQEYRVRDLFMEAHAVSDKPDSDRNLMFSRYNITMESSLELKDEKALSLPDYKSPVFPVYVEGKVVSEQGKEDEKTYQVYEHSETKLDCYRVEIPVFDGKEVVVPYEPFFVPGHFYFPAFKGQRVLVALDFHTARIERFLDVRPGGRLPMESQGNHLLLGKTAEDCTSINHVYVDGKPELNIKRTLGNDTEKIQVHEGTIILETKEE